MRDRIPFQRARELADMEKITASLYPLFVDKIGTLPVVIAAATHEQQVGLVETLASQPLSLHHHRPIDNVIAPYPGAEGLGMDLAYSFPTLPTNSLSKTIGMRDQGGSYDWTNRTVASGFQSGQPMMTDSHPYSTPTTPETTPSGASTPTLQPCRSHPYYSAAALRQSPFCYSTILSFKSHCTVVRSLPYPVVPDQWYYRLKWLVFGFDHACLSRTTNSQRPCSPSVGGSQCRCGFYR